MQTEFDAWFEYAGPLHTILLEAVDKDDRKRFYIIVVYGLGRPIWSEWSMGRCDWIALEFCIVLRQWLLDASTETVEAWEFIQKRVLTKQDNISRHVVWILHKMTVQSLQQQASAAVSNDCTDFFNGSYQGAPLRYNSGYRLSHNWCTWQHIF